jgi:hypothetical protein
VQLRTLCGAGIIDFEIVQNTVVNVLNPNAFLKYNSYNK